MKKSYFILFTVILCTVLSVKAQIYEPESINMPGSWDGFSNPPTIDALRNPNQSPSGDITLITTGTRRYQTTIHCASSGGDVTPGPYDWEFSSGPDVVGQYYNNNWKNVDVIMNTLQTYSWNSGLDNNTIVLSDGKWYTMNFEDKGYVDTRAIFMETTGAPVPFDSATSTVQTPPNNITDGTPVTVFGTLDAAPNSELRVFIRYSTDGFATSDVVEMTNSIPALPAEVDGIIPGTVNTGGTTVDYYLFTTTVDATTITDESEYDLVTIDIENNNGPNYSYTVVNTVTTVSSGNWEDGSTWSGGTVPNATDNLQINHAVTINSDIEHSGNITLNSPNVLTITPGHSLKFSGANFTNNGGVILESSSTSYSSFIPSTSSTIAGTGEFDYIRHTNSNTNGTGNDLISSPVVGETFDVSFATNLLENPTTPGEYAFGIFNNGTGLYENFNTTDNNGATLVSGVGYRAATDATPTVSFTGTVATADVPIGITVGTHPTFGKWNLIGNPYPSYLDFATFFAANSSQLDSGFQAVYGYNADTSVWTIWNQAIIDDTGVTEKITPGQGFFVASAAGGGTVNFTTAMRTTGASDDFIVGDALSVDVALAKLQLTKGSEIYTTDIYFNSNATQNLDPGYDAGAFGGDATGIFTELVQGNTGIELAIQALAYTDFNDVVVPLGIKANAGEQITISLDAATLTIPSSINVYLEDTVESSFTLLTSTDYIHTLANDMSSTGRYFVHFTNTTLSNSEFTESNVLVYTNNATKTLHIKGYLEAATQMHIYDLNGRQVMQLNLESSETSHTISTENLTTGIYVVTLNNTKQNITQKLIIN